MTQKVEFCIDQGTDFACSFLCVDGAGNPIDFTGYTARMQLKRFFYGSPIDELSSENGRLVFDNARGEISATFPHDKTALYPPGKLYFDMLIGQNGQTVYRLFEGIARVSPGVTNELL